MYMKEEIESQNIPCNLYEKLTRLQRERSYRGGFVSLKWKGLNLEIRRKDILVASEEESLMQVGWYVGVLKW